MLTAVGRKSWARDYPGPVIRRLLAIGAAVALGLAWVPAGTAASGPRPPVEPGLATGRKSAMTLPTQASTPPRTRFPLPTLAA